MSRIALIAVCLIAALPSMAEEDSALTDGEIWNRGVDFYRAGDTTNALAVLRPLMLSRTHGARAAEVVAKLEHEAAHEPGAPDALKHLEEAAAAAQIALRASPDDPRANANFTRATEGLKGLREAKRINGIVEAAKNKDPGSMLQAAVGDVRRLLSDSMTYRTNDPVRAVALSDAMSSRASRLADVWIPVKEIICQAVTNEEDAATISSRVDAARTKTEEAARLLGDMDDEARYRLAEAEQSFTDFFKMTVMPPAAIREDLVAQSNAWQDVAVECGRPWQPEALDYTRAFRAKFPAWAQAYEQQAAADTNKPPFTAEAQAEISDLSTRLEKIQIECCKESLPPKQEEAVGIIRRIIELLPNDGKGGGGQQQQQQQNNQQQQQQKQNDQGQDDQNQQQQQQDDPQQGQDDQQGQEDQKDDQQGEDGEDEKSADEKEIEAVLRKAQERSDEHEADKKARARKVRLPPNERDW